MSSISLNISNYVSLYKQKGFLPVSLYTENCSVLPLSIPRSVVKHIVKAVFESLTPFRKHLFRYGDIFYMHLDTFNKGYKGTYKNVFEFFCYKSGLDYKYFSCSFLNFNKQDYIDHVESEGIYIIEHDDIVYVFENVPYSCDSLSENEIKNIEDEFPDFFKGEKLPKYDSEDEDYDSLNESEDEDEDEDENEDENENEGENEGENEERNDNEDKEGNE